MTDLADLIRAERLALVELLETLTPQEWTTPSLCDAWTVQDVAAHLAWAPVQGPWDAAVLMAKGGFDLNKVNATNAIGWSRRGTTSILQQLRENAGTGAKPIGMPQVSALADALVHALDIRRPLDRPRPAPADAVVRAADFLAATRWPMTIPVGGSVRKRLHGVRLVADDVGWARGDGPEVRGSGDAVLLLLTGRPLARSELSGPGADRVYARLTG